MDNDDRVFGIIERTLLMTEYRIWCNVSVFIFQYVKNAVM